MYKYLNRPISPHLSIYKAQNSSLASIWHRFSAIILICLLLCFLLSGKIIIWNLNFLFSYKIFLILSKAGFSPLNEVAYLVMFFYHFLNGLRHIVWDFNYLLSKKQLNYSFYIICIWLLFIVLIYIFIKYT